MTRRIPPAAFDRRLDIAVLGRDGVAFDVAPPRRQESTEIIAARAADPTYPVLCSSGE